MKTFLLLVLAVMVSALTAEGQANGKLQMHFMDVGQGDATLLVTPGGETVLFDNGVCKHCSLPVSYLRKIGVTQIDYLVTSHYHDDHIGCTREVLAAFPLQKDAFDRGDSFPSTVFERYLDAVGTHRKTAVPGQNITLTTGSAVPVVIEFIAENGDGVVTTNENDLSLVAVVRFGDFDAVMGGDLSGYHTGNYEDIESLVAGKVGPVEVYKVNHHCSQYSTNENWVTTVHPKVAVISASKDIGRNHGHPTADCLERLHNTGVKSYWTETGGGAAPDPLWDVVGGNIVVQVVPGSEEFTVTYDKGTRTDTFPDWNTADTGTPVNQVYGWSRKSDVYHYIDCSAVAKIKPANLEKGSAPPTGKHLHTGCPK
jgi:beta-lactamase superfamily II metal-dependent hydrolase